MIRRLSMWNVFCRCFGSVCFVKFDSICRLCRYFGGMCFVMFDLDAYAL